MYTRVSEKLSSRQKKKKKKGDTWVYNISVNLNSTCICTIVQGDVKEISFFFFISAKWGHFYRRYTCISSVGCVCTRLYWYKLNIALLVMGITPKNWISPFILGKTVHLIDFFFFFFYFDLYAWFVSLLKKLWKKNKDYLQFLQL